MMTLDDLFGRTLEVRTSVLRDSGTMTWELAISWPNPDESQDDLLFKTTVPVEAVLDGTSTHVAIREAERKAIHHVAAQLQGAAYAACLETGAGDEWGFTSALDYMKRSDLFGWAF